jgi:hypothetical protein
MRLNDSLELSQGVTRDYSLALEEEGQVRL